MMILQMWKPQSSQSSSPTQTRQRRRIWHLRHGTMKTSWMTIAMLTLILYSHYIVPSIAQDDNATAATTTLVPTTSPTSPPKPQKGDSSSGLLTDNLLVRRWKIYEPNVNYDDLEFKLNFNVSDYIISSHVGYQIYDGHLCSDGSDVITNANYFNVDISQNNDVRVGDGWGLREIQISTTIIPENIVKSNSYQEQQQSNTGSDGTTDGGSATKAAINYCVRLSLFNNIPSDPTAAEINWMETKITLFVNLAGGFTVESSYVEPKPPKLEIANDEFFVEAYLCGSDGNPFPNITSKTFMQGEPVSVCVKPTLEAINAGVRMKRINRFRFQRNAQSQDAIINDGIPANNGLTDILCSEGSLLCSFSTLLVAKFYDGPGTVYGIGEATLQFGRSSVSSTTTRSGGGGNNRYKERQLLLEANGDNNSATTPRELKDEELEVQKSIFIPHFPVELNEHLFEVIRGKSGATTTLLPSGWCNVAVTMATFLELGFSLFMC